MYKASHSACQGAYRRLVRDASGPRRLLHGIKLGRRRQPPDLHDRLKVHSHERSLRQQSNPSELQVQPMNAACQRAHADIMSMTSNLPRATPLLACLVRSQSWPTASERRPLSRKPRLSQGGSTSYSALCWFTYSIVIVVRGLRCVALYCVQAHPSETNDIPVTETGLRGSGARGARAPSGFKKQ